MYVADKSAGDDRIPVAIPNYLERAAGDPAGLCHGELAVWPRLHRTAVTVVRFAFSDLIIPDTAVAALRDARETYGDAMIIAPSHRDDTDILATGVLLRSAGLKAARYIAKAELMERRWKAALLGHLGGIPVDRHHAGEDADRRALDGVVAHTLEEEERPMVVYPEATRYSGPLIREEIKAGAAFYAARHQVPIIPIGIAGTEGATRRLLKERRRSRVAVSVSRPIEPSRRIKANTAVLRTAMQDVFDEANALL